MHETIRALRRLCYAHDAGGLTDGELLGRFVERNNELAFEALVRRHGPMVMGVCRRILGNHHDAEDAFQATFLVLARKAATVAPKEMIANWLYGVALRTARKARAQAVRRETQERKMRLLPARCSQPHDSSSELQAILDKELTRLPDKYRAAILLCGIEGKTHKEAAHLLGWPEGTLSVRLMRAKELLAKRLARRNLGLPAGALLAVVSPNLASAGVSSALVASTAKAANLFAAGNAVAAGAISAPVASLAEGVLRAMVLTMVKSALAVLLIAGSLCVGVGYSTQFLKADGDAKALADQPKPIAAQSPKAQPKITPKEEPPPQLDLPPGAIVRIGSVPFRTGAVHAWAMAPDGKSIFISTEKDVRVIDLESALLLRSFRTTDNPPLFHRFSIAVSPDGKLLAASSENGAYLWDAQSGKKVRALESNPFDYATFSHDGSKLAISADGLCVLDVATGKVEYQILEKTHVFSQVLLTPNGQTLIAVGGVNNELIVVDLKKKKLLNSPLAAGAFAPLVALSPDGKTLALREAHNRPNLPRSEWTLRLIDLETGLSRSVDQSDVPQSSDFGLLYSPNGKSLVASLDTHFHVIDVASGKAMRRFERGKTTRRLEAGNNRVCFTPDGKRLVQPRSTIQVWDFESGKELHPPEGPQEIADSVALSPDGKTLASCMMRGNSQPIFLWDARTGKLKSTLDGHAPGTCVRKVEFAPDGRLLSVGQDGTFRIWDVVAFKETACFEMLDPMAGKTYVWRADIGISADGRTALVAFDVVKPANKHQFRIMAWHLPDGKLLEKRDVIATVDEPQRNPDFIDFDITPGLSPSGSSYLIATDEGFCLKNLFTNRTTARLKTYPQVALADALNPDLLGGPFRFSRDGRTVAAVGAQLVRRWNTEFADGHNIAIFDLPSGKERLRIPLESFQTLFALSPDGRRLAATTGHNVRIFDTATGARLWEMPDVGVRVTALAYNADGTRLIAALDYMNIFIWDVSSTNPKK